MDNNKVTVNAPASKSLSHRTLIAAALAGGESRVRHTLDSVDLQRTRECLQAMGATIEEDGDALVVNGMAGLNKDGSPANGGPRGGGLNDKGKLKDKKAEPVNLYVHESGTTGRLITAVAASGKGRFRVDGAPRMCERPMLELTNALQSLGVDIEFEGQEGYMPFIMTTNGYKKKQVSITLEESSQYLSGLLLGAPQSETDTTITVEGKKAVSWPYVALTLRIMEDFKADFDVQIRQDGEFVTVPWQSIRSVEPGGLRFIVRPKSYESSDYRVEGDWSNASYFLAAGAVGKRPVEILGINSDSLQGDRAILDIVAQMGAGIDVKPGKGITIFPRPLRGMNLDMGKSPDLVPTVAVMAAFAESPTIIRNVAHLRIKECDRLQACVDQVAKVGAKTEVIEDGLKITPAGIPDGTDIQFETYGDHRIAMSMSIFELGGVNVSFDDPDCVSKSFPTFFDEWAKVTV